MSKFEHYPTHIIQPESQTIRYLVIANNKLKRVLLHSLQVLSKPDDQKRARFETLILGFIEALLL